MEEMKRRDLRALSRADLIELLVAQNEQLSSLEPQEASPDSQEASSPSDEAAEKDLTPERLAAEQARLTRRQRAARMAASTVGTILVVAALAVIVAVYAFPVFRIQGSSMEPTLMDGDVVVAHKGAMPATGDLVAFYRGNDLLVKRVIATAGQWVDIDRYGNVSVDGQPLDEPYLTTKARGTCDITLPYQVPESHVFVMGDERDISIDSRSSEVGCVATDNIAGIIDLRVWPLGGFGVPGANAS